MKGWGMWLYGCNLLGQGIGWALRELADSGTAAQSYTRPMLPLPSRPSPALPPCPAVCRSVCTEAGMFAIRARRHTVTEDDFLKAVNKVRSSCSRSCLVSQASAAPARPPVCSTGPQLNRSHTLCPPLAGALPSTSLVPQVVREYSKFSSTPKYMVYR